jgi:hypothetical protein
LYKRKSGKEEEPFKKVYLISGLDEQWLAMAKEIFGETPESRQRLVGELKEVALERGFVGLPTQKSFYLKMLRAGKKYFIKHINRKTTLKSLATIY